MGATQSCYEYHLVAASAGETEEEMMANAELHCPHARGEAMCVDTTPVEPSAEATAFCDLYTTTCGDWTAETASRSVAPQWMSRIRNFSGYASP